MQCREEVFSVRPTGATNVVTHDAIAEQAEGRGDAGVDGGYKDNILAVLRSWIADLRRRRRGVEVCKEGA